MLQTLSQQADDVVFVEHRREPRIIVSVPGRYALASRRDTRGNRREFACRIVNISLHAMALVVPVNGPTGERVITHCDEFGKLEGSIARVLDRGFVMTIAATNEERAKLSDRIDWYENIKNHDLSDGRKHKRIAPKDPRSTLFWPTIVGWIVSSSTCQHPASRFLPTLNQKLARHSPSEH